eukprot:TRINITY_DN37253_c0_g1_i2.p1 TRINITY_DN37253_c0_g1~~TRINITY_DN37253_c0_g1_i2.p1  ORF type:complete len:810 (+),score=221.00 TRINITY_DN37253_c0_g1_i2:40-2469(+)
MVLRKRTRAEEPLRKDVHRAIADIGMVRCNDVEKIKQKVESAVDVMSMASKEDVELGKNSFVKCVIGVPGGCRGYATFLRVMGKVDEDVASGIMQKIKERLQAATASHEWHAVAAIYRFIGLLSRYGTTALPTESLLAILNQARSAVIPARASSMVYLLLSTLPWYGADAFKELESELAEYFKQRVKSQTLLPFRPVHVQQFSFIQDQKTVVETGPDMLETLHRELCGEEMDIPELFEEIKWSDKELTWSCGDISLPLFPEHHERVIYADIPVSLNLYHSWTDGKPVRIPMKPASEADTTFNPADVLAFDERDAMPLAMRVVARELTVATIRCFHSDVELLQTTLSHLLCIKAFPYMVIESVFNSAFTLPHPPLPLVFYTTFLTRLCQDNTSPFLLPTVEAFDTLNELLPTLDPELSIRLMTMFAGHLSSFGYKWLWEQQEKDADHRTGTCKKLFNMELVHQLTRSASKAMLSEAVPPSFDKAGLLKEEQVTRYKYAKDVEFKKDADKLLGRLAGDNCSVEEVVEMLNSMNENGKDATEKEKADAIVNCLLFIGSDSVAHEKIIFHKYAQVIKQVIHYNCNVISAAAQFWESHPHHIVMTIANLLQLDIVSFLDVVKWSFSLEISEMYERSFIWEVIYMAIDTLVEKVYRSYEDLIDLEGASQVLDGMDQPQNVKAKAKRQVEKKIVKLETMLHQSYLYELRAGFKTLFEGLTKKIKCVFEKQMFCSTIQHSLLPPRPQGVWLAVPERRRDGNPKACSKELRVVQVSIGPPECHWAKVFAVHDAVHRRDLRGSVHKGTGCCHQHVPQLG